MSRKRKLNRQHERQRHNETVMSLIKRLREETISEMEQLMTLNVSSWEQFTEEQLEKVQRINAYQLAEIGDSNLQIAVKRGELSEDEYAKIRKFIEWGASLGGYEDSEGPVGPSEINLGEAFLAMRDAELPAELSGLENIVGGAGTAIKEALSKHGKTGKEKIENGTE